MRRLAILLFLITTALPAIASKRVTVEQLEQTLAPARGESDADLAQQLSGLELGERLSASRFAKLKSEMPGEKALQALIALADSAEFLGLPAAEIPANPTPLGAAQRQMMALVVTYVTKTVHQLPNFFATRDTNRFEDNPHFTVSYMPLHYVTKSSKKVFYRDGKEMVVTEAGKVKTEESDAQGLVSWGEFGPIMGTVLLDAAQSTLAWSRWEQEAGGPQAVFSYAVPSAKSHYSVHFCCVIETSGDAQPPFNAQAGYHGEMAIDPASGAILRLTVEADFQPNSPLSRAAIMVEYGKVEIGGKDFYCPVRSVAISRIKVSHNSEGAQSILTPDPLRTYLNDVAFGQYHRLGSEARILNADGTEPSEGLPPPGSGGAAASGPQTLTAASPDAAEQIPPSAPEPAAEAPPMPAAAIAPTAPPLSEPEANLSADSGVSDRGGQAVAHGGQEQVPLVRANAHDVVVDVVVTKGDGEPVRALGKQAFEVLEDGKPQAIDYFEEHTAAEARAFAEPQLPPNMFTNTPAAPESDSVNVVLIDHLNTPIQDQVRVHQQILDFLTKMQPGTRIAVFQLGSKLRLIQTFTSDSAALRAALNDKKAGDTQETTSASRSHRDDLDDQEHVDTHAAQMGAKQSILGGYQDTGAGGPSGGQASIAANQGGERVTMTLEALDYLARYLAGIPVRKNLIWFSSSFPVSFFPSLKEEQAHSGRQNYSAATKEAAGLLTSSKVAVYPVSAEGLQLDNATEATSHGQTSQDSLYQLADARAIRTEEVNKLAADTGGKAFYNTNDLAAALARAIDDGAHYYTLEYSPANTQMDGKYRRIEVRLAEGKYDLAYRRGYYADDQVAPAPKPDSDPLQPFMHRGAPGSTQILLKVRNLPATQRSTVKAQLAGGNTKLAGPLTRYRVDISIRAVDVALHLESDGRYTGKIQLGLVAYDHDGQALNWAGGTMPINVGADAYAAMQRSGIPAHIEIDLPNTAAFMEAGVFDWSTRKAGTLEIPILSTDGNKPGVTAPGFQAPGSPGTTMGMPGAQQR